MAAQAMPVLDQEQLFTGQVITLHHHVMGKRMVARHRYDDWIFRDLHRLDIAKSVRNGHQQDIEFSCGELVQQNRSRSLPDVQLELRQRSAQMWQQRGQDIRPDCRDYAEPERPGQWLLRVAGQPDQFLGVDQQALGARRDLFPKGVSITWRWLRSNSVMPSLASSSLIPPLSVDCVTAQLSAARPKWHCSARAHRKRSC